MSILWVIIQVFLLVAFFMAGVAKLLGGQKQVDMFQELGIPQWMRLAAGTAEIFGAIILAIGFMDPKYIASGGLIIGMTMIGAVVTHLLIKDPIAKSFVPLIFALLAFTLTYSQLTHLSSLF